MIPCDLGFVQSERPDECQDPQRLLRFAAGWTHGLAPCGRHYCSVPCAKLWRVRHWHATGAVLGSLDAPRALVGGKLAIPPGTGLGGVLACEGALVRALSRAAREGRYRAGILGVHHFTGGPLPHIDFVAHFGLSTPERHVRQLSRHAGLEFCHCFPLDPGGWQGWLPYLWKVDMVDRLGNDVPLFYPRGLPPYFASWGFFQGRLSR